VFACPRYFWDPNERETCCAGNFMTDQELPSLPQPEQMRYHSVTYS
jgi:hypothetical protein